MVGVAVLYLALQIAVAMMGGTVLAFVEVALHGDEGAYGEALAKSAIYGLSLIHISGFVRRRGVRFVAVD